MADYSQVVLADILRGFGLSVVEHQLSLVGDSLPAGVVARSTSTLETVAEDTSISCNLLLDRSGTWHFVGSGAANEAISICVANATNLWVPQQDENVWREVAASVGAELIWISEANASGVPGYRLVEPWTDTVVSALAKGVCAILRTMRWQFDVATTEINGVSQFYFGLETWPNVTWQDFVRAHDIKPRFPTPESPLYEVQPNDTWESIASVLLGNASRADEIIALNGNGSYTLRPSDFIVIPEDGVVEYVDEPTPATEPLDPYEPFIVIDDTIIPNLPIIRPNDQSSDVLMLQYLLTAFGYDCGTLDGLYGIRTDESIKRFQLDNQLPETGVFTAREWAALLGNDPLPLVDSSIDAKLVKCAQVLLLLNTFNPGAIDGVYRDSVETATRAFQDSVGLPVSGRISSDNHTWQALLGLL